MHDALIFYTMHRKKARRICKNTISGLSFYAEFCFTYHL